MSEAELQKASEKFIGNLQNIKSALEVLEIVDLMPYDLQEEASKEELLKQISSPTKNQSTPVAKRATPTKLAGTPGGGSAGGFNFYSSTFDEIINMVCFKPLEVLDRKTIRAMNLYIIQNDDLVL